MVNGDLVTRPFFNGTRPRGISVDGELAWQYYTGIRPPSTSLMRDGLAPGSGLAGTVFMGTGLFRDQVESVEIIDVSNPLGFLTASEYRDRPIVHAADITHPQSIDPAITFYTTGDTPGLFKVYTAGVQGVAMSWNGANFFRLLTSAKYIDLTLLDVSRVTSFASMFNGTSQLTSFGDLSNWDFTNAISMNSMFNNCQSLISLGDTSGWKTPNCETLANMHLNNFALMELDYSGFNTSKVTTMTSTFNSCRSLVSVGDLSSWDTSHCTTFGSMFLHCHSLKKLVVSGWDTTTADNISQMFRNTNVLESFDLTDWVLPTSTNQANIFTGSGANVAYVNTVEMQAWVQNAQGWTRVPPRKIILEV